MTRWLLSTWCLLVLFAGWLTRSELETRRQPAELLNPELLDQKEPTLQSALAVGQTATVELQELRDALSQLRKDERPEQLADWAMFGLLLSSGLSSEEFRNATYDKAPFRLGSLDETMNFDYGPGRRVILHDDMVWLLYSHSDKQRTATLARLADQVRMELGKIPSRFLVFRYEVEGDPLLIRLQREADIGSETMFGPDFGYAERSVSSLADLESLTNSIDDLTHVDFSKYGQVRFGGRRFKDVRTLGVSVSDIAALYQAHVHLDGYGEPGFSLDPHWDVRRLIEDLERIIKGPPESAIASLVEESLRDNEGRTITDSSVPVSYEAAKTILKFNKVSQSVVGVPPESATRWQALSAELRVVLNTVRGNRRIEYPSGSDQDVLAFIKLREELRAQAEVEDLPGLLAYRALLVMQLLEARNRFQCARYDGPLQGTRVGMNLFYTDLMAKLWESLDYYRSAPVESVVGFYSQPLTGMEIEPLYWEEMKRLNGTRLWFGTRAEGYAVDDSGERFSFAHIATRVFAKGSNQLRPGEEEPPNEHSRRALSWWDRHYAQVADFEQQYHLQNQIMKWSIATGLMAEKQKVATAYGESPPVQYLANVSVDHSLRFDKYYHGASDLRFREDIRFRPESKWITGTECIEILQSYPFQSEWSRRSYIAGGVSLGGGRALQTGSRISLNVASQLRRGGVNYASSSSTLGSRAWSLLPRSLRPGSRLSTIKGTDFRLPAILHRSRASVSIDVARTARVRQGGIELQSRTVGTELMLGRSSGQLAIRAGDTHLSSLSFVRTRQGLRLGSGSKGSLPSSSIQGRVLSKVNAPYEVRVRGLQRGGVVEVEESSGLRTMYIAPEPVAVAANPSVRMIAVRDVVAGQPKSLDALLQTGVTRSPGQIQLMEALPVQPGAARSAIRQSPWQRLEVAESVQQPGEVRVGQIFTSRSPSNTGRPVIIETADAALPKVEGVIADHALYLKRPVNASPAAQRSFEALPQRMEVQGSSLQRAIKQAELANSEAAAVRIQANQLGEELGVRITEKIRQGDVSGLLAELRQARLSGRISNLAKEINRSRQQLAEVATDGSLPAVHKGGVEDSKLLGHFNADSSLGHSVSTPDAAIKSAPSVSDFGQAATGFRPRQLATPQAQATAPAKQATPNPAQALQNLMPNGQSSAPPTLAQQTVLPCAEILTAASVQRADVFRCCDINRDGKLEQAEQLLCCDRNQDRKLEPSELAACRLP